MLFKKEYTDGSEGNHRGRNARKLTFISSSGVKFRFRITLI